MDEFFDFDFMKSNQERSDSTKENEDTLAEKVVTADSAEKDLAEGQPELQNGYLAKVREYEELLEQEEILESRVEECRKNVETKEENCEREIGQKNQALTLQRKELRKRVGEQRERILDFYYKNHDILTNDLASNQDDEYSQYVSKTYEIAEMFDMLYSLEKDKELCDKSIDDLSDGAVAVTESDTQSRDVEHNSDLEDAREALRQAVQKLEENKGELIKCGKDLINWDTRSVLNDREPSLQKEILFTVGDDVENAVFVLRHNLEPFNVQYTCEDPQSDISKALNDVIYRMHEGFEKINAPELLQIHIIDEINGGKALQIDPRFLGKICRVDRMNQYGPGTFVYGKNTRLLDEYLREQWDSIINIMNENLSQFDIEDLRQQHPQDYPIYIANKARREPAAGVAPLSPFAYKVLFILVPRKEDEGAGSLDIINLLNMIDESFCTSGILPIFFSDADSVNEKYQKYVDKGMNRFHIQIN